MRPLTRKDVFNAAFAALCFIALTGIALLVAPIR